MNLSPRRLATGATLLAATGVVAALAAGPLFVAGADHLDTPTVKADHRIDITDLYTFANGSGTAFVLNVNPLTSPADSKSASFRSGALYELHIDVNGDALADIVYRVRFGGVHTLASGSVQQAFEVARATGGSAHRTEWTGAVIASGRTTPVGGAVQTALMTGGGRAFAGLRDDPFFFDLPGFINFKAKLLAGSTNLSELLGGFTGTDFFAGTNVSSIVITVPNSQLAPVGRTIGVWATTSIATSTGWRQVDRMARPAINTVFNNSTAEKEAANRLSPLDDRALDADNVRAVLDAIGNVLTANSLSAYSSAQKTAITNTLLPDILTYKVGNTAGFLNGRRLGDDVIDAEFSLLTNGHVTSDGVNHNDASFGAFPFLAAPHL